MDNLFKGNFFSEYFAILRDPIERFKSAFYYQKYLEKNDICQEKECNYFINEFLLKNYQKQGWCDNHFQTQISFLIPKRRYKLFVMNPQGIKDLKNYIDQIIFQKDNKGDFPKINSSRKGVSNYYEDIVLNEDSYSLLTEIYQKDIDLFKELNNNCSPKREYIITEKNSFKTIEN